MTTVTNEIKVILIIDQYWFTHESVGLELINRNIHEETDPYQSIINTYSIIEDR